MARTATRMPGEDTPSSTTTDSTGGTDAGDTIDQATAASSAVTTADVLDGAARAGIAGAPQTIEERFAAMEAEQNRLREENENLRRGQQHLLDIARANPRATGVEPPAALPKAAEFTGENQGKQDDLKASVLTQDGWVVPKHLGSSPVLHQLAQLGLSATA